MLSQTSVPGPTGKARVTATGVACAACGAEASRAGARFCDACGSPLSVQDSHAEFKQVTVLFADVVGSMELATALGAERLREIMTALVERAARVVKRYGGTVDKFTGDGIMAVFGAPVALEDHAIRACRAALDIQNETARLAAETDRSDGVTLKLRVGLNSGEVIVGEIGSGTLGYTAIGEQVGMAQRMESVAPAGGVMLTESTGRLVEDAMELGEPQVVHIKGSDMAVTAQQLLGIGSQIGRRSFFNLVGRRWETAAVEAILDRSIDGHGSVISVVGPAGIGKSRIVAEAIALAAIRGVPVFSTYCESHASDIPFFSVSRLLRGAFGVDELADDRAARAYLRSRIVDALHDDLLLLEDLLGIRDPAEAPPLIDPDARRRRLTALVNGVSLARSTPAVYVIEDVHWIDEVSESLMTEFLTVIPQTCSLVLLTYRPEYRGALTRTLGSQMIALAPLDDSEATTLIAELLGPDPSVVELTAQIADRAAGNPFFAQEIVRDLADRRVLRGERGAYRCSDPTTVVSVPATLQAAIAARIDRLGEVAKRTLNAAAVMGMRFGPDLSAVLEGDTALTELVHAELIDQVRFTPNAEYAFHNPLIRTVAYESQLRADRAALHRRLADAIVRRDPDSADENAALIAEHLEAAGDLAPAYEWHMRAGTWLTNRDLAAAHASWYRAQQVADQLPADHPGRMNMRIAPRTLLTGGGWRLRGSGADVAFDELRELCELAGDKRSLAIGMTGLVMKHALNSEYEMASDLASEQIALLDSIDDPELTIGLSFAPIAVKYQAADAKEMLRLVTRVIELAEGDPTRGSMFFGSPLALAIMFRGGARSAFGIPGWKADYRDAIAMARGADAVTLSVVVFYIYVVGIPYGIFRADAVVLADTKEALERAERSGDEATLAVARSVRGIVLSYCDSPECDDGVGLLEQVSEAIRQDRFSHPMTAYINIELARARARAGDLDGAIELCRPYANSNQNDMTVFGLAVTILVESLLRRGGDADDDEVDEVIGDLAAYATKTSFVVYSLIELRMRALVARARGDAAAYRDFVERYRAEAESLGFDGHIAMAEAMQ
jgi:adenylate cyclase